jgi:hypothetical protein
MTDETGAAADTADEREYMDEQSHKGGGGFFRFLLIGLVIGAAIAFFSGRNGDDDDEDFGEENWIEVKHETSDTGASVPTAVPSGAAQASNEADADESAQ